MDAKRSRVKGISRQLLSWSLGIVIGAILGAAFTPLFTNWVAPDPSGIVGLMDDEVRAGNTHDLGLVARIYTADAAN